MIAFDGPPTKGYMIAEANKFTKSGLSVIPVDRTKRPTIAWARRQQEIPSDIELLEFENATGLGVVCGKVSGGLEVLDFDAKHYPEGRDFYKEWFDRVPEPIAKKLTLLIKTPSGGWHVPYRCAEVSGNSKLARVPNSEYGGPEKVPEFLEVIETRGEGGYVATWPTQGYEVTSGSWGKVPVLTADERDTVLAVARSLDEGRVRPYTHQAGPRDMRRPGDEFAERTTWAEILEPHGWAVAYERGGEEYWTRPGKKVRDGTSATTNFKGSDLLKVFTSNGHPFEPDATYTKFAAHAFLNFGGDMSAAARSLSGQGYGERRTINNYETPNILSRPRSKFVTLDDIKEKPIHWLVKGLIPLGEYTILAGPPGTGKSTIAQAIGTAVTNGDEIWGWQVEQGEVVFLSAEQSVSCITKPRFRLMGADTSKVVCLDDERDGEIVMFSLDKQGVDELDEAMAGRNVRLMVVDTGDSYFEAEKNINSMIDVRQWLNRLIALARKHNFAVLIIMHLNKAYGMDPLNRIAGSVTWGGACRSALICNENKNVPDEYAIINVKNNFARKGWKTGYTLVEAAPEVSVVQWCQTDVTEAQLCEAPQTSEATDKRQECASWLREVLLPGPMSATTMERRCEEKGYSRRVWSDAKKIAGVVSERDKFGEDGSWQWRLRDS